MEVNMSTIQVSFMNDTSTTQTFAIFDMKGSDPTTSVFEDILEPEQQVGPFQFETDDDVFGKARWVSEFNGQSTVDIQDGDVVNMSVTG
jgi:hypothetical protein